MKSENIILKKSFNSALSIIELYRTLLVKHEYVISKQLLKSGTSVGANIHESQSAESRRDFIHKLQIALKEARETEYWINLLLASQYVNNEQCRKPLHDLIEVKKLLISIIMTSKKSR
jgi:four helix bundle protein